MCRGMGHKPARLSRSQYELLLKLDTNHQGIAGFYSNQTLGSLYRRGFVRPSWTASRDRRGSLMDTWHITDAGGVALRGAERSEA